MLVQTRVDPGFRTIDYDSKELRKPLRKAGNDVRKLARKLISRRSVSDAGDFPGRDSGEMQRSLRVKVSRSGYSVSVYPTKTQRMPVYYPAFVVYGHRGPGSETLEQSRCHKKRPGEKVAKPRKNFVPAAAEQYSGTFHETMANALANAIKPGIV
jgi:hypothetical protein